MQDKREEVRIVINKEIEVTQKITYDRYVTLPNPMKLLIVNMSCVGILIKSTIEILPNTCFFVNLPLGKETIPVIIQIIRLQEPEQSGEFQYGCRFLQTHEPQRKKIRKFIFDEQLRQRRKLK